MRALTITMSAFGPYRERQTVNFTELGEESIFLITGPTGAGKTTIFDAMCFALYGRASGSDRDQDSMRSHFADPDEPTYVDFEFELRGKTYRVVRMPKQSKRKERGDGWKEEPARAELYMSQPGNEKLIASKIKEVNDYIEEIMGLDYEQFRKMIMIPQGEFRKLISENSKEREEILQRIFKTQFFAQLSDYFKQQSKKLENEIDQFEWKINQEKSKIHWGIEGDEALENEKLSTVQDLLDKRLVEQSEQLVEEKNHLEQLQQDTDEHQRQYYKAKQLREQFDEWEVLQTEKKQLDDQRQVIDRMEKDLQWADKAARVLPYDKQYKERKQELNQWKTAQRQKEEQWNKRAAEFSTIEKQYKEEENKEDIRAELKEQWNQKIEEKEKLDEYRKLNDQLLCQQKNVTEKKKVLDSLQEQHQQVSDQKQKLKEIVKEERGVAQQQYEKNNHYQEQLKRRQALDQLQNEWKRLLEMRSSYQKFMKQFRMMKDKQEKAKKEYESALEKIGNHHAYTLSLQLEIGTPCPVCGSTEHPNPAGKPQHVPGEQEVAQLKQHYEEADQNYQKLQEKAVEVKSDGETQRQLTENIHHDLSGIVTALDNSSIQEAASQCHQEILSLEKEISTLNQHANDIEKAVKNLEHLDEKATIINEKMETARTNYYEHQQELTKVQTHVQTIKENFSYSTLDAAVIEKEVQVKEEAYKKAQKTWEEIQVHYTKKRDQLKQLQVTVEEGRKYGIRAEKALEQQKEEFDQTLVQFSFSSIEDYQKALRPSEEMEEMQKKVQDYQQRSSINNDRLNELNQKLDTQSKPDVDAVEANWLEKRKALAEQQEKINEMSISFRQNRAVQQTMQRLVEQQDTLASKYYDIADLAQLAKGDNHLRLSLERYVLASFLDEILVQANLRLDQMTDHRYQLVRSDAVAKRGAQSGLDLEVIDHHTGLQRSVRTLSGGEGFKASLSLALGMADVVQSHAGGVQLDTLFIDEGFGTLDELSLEQAIDCLRSLQDGNRMLGIISHVPQLKEEIPAKLQILTGPRGSSVEFIFQ